MSPRKREAATTLYNNSIQPCVVNSANGVYFLVRGNKRLFHNVEKYSNLTDKGRLFFTTGYEQQLFYPLHIYAGLGIAYQKHISFNNHFVDIEKRMNINTDFGLSLHLSFLKFRAGMTVPKFDLKDSFLAFAAGINF